MALIPSLRTSGGGGAPVTHARTWPREARPPWALWTSTNLGAIGWRIRALPMDAVTMVSAFVVLQFAIPARLVVAGTGAAGRPSIGVAVAVAFLWGLQRLRRSPVRRRLGLVGVALSFYAAVEVLAWSGGHARGLPEQEATGSDRSLLITMALAGMAIAIAQGVSSRKRLDVLLRRIVYGAVFMAVIGALQFLAGIDLTPHLRLPGLSPNRALIGVSSRGGPEFARVAGTATHYIEYGVVLAAVLPVAIHFAMTARGRLQRRAQQASALVIGACIPFSISRSAVVALLLAGGVLIWGWPWRTRAKALAVAFVGVLAYRALQPGLLGTLKALFEHADDDPSITNRVSDYAYVRQMVSERPLIGRGPGTFLPDLYILLDNQLLLTLVSSGALGLVGLLGLFLSGYGAGRSVRLRADDEVDRHLGQALTAGLMGLLVASATFDALSFSTFSGLTFLLLGAAGALVRLSLTDAGQPLSRAPRGSALVHDPFFVRLRGST
jgi:hypothetical protein